MVASNKVKQYVILAWKVDRKKGITVGEMLDMLKAQLKPIARHEFYLMVRSMGACDDEAKQEWNKMKEQVRGVRKA